jgi:hypothetical protein
LKGKGRTIIRKKVVVILAILTAGAILSIYIYDMFFCVFEETLISILALIITLAILIGTISWVIILKKKGPAEMTAQT